MTQLRSLNERRKIKLNNLARHLNVRLWSFLVRNCVPLLVSNLVQHTTEIHGLSAGQNVHGSL